MCRPSPRAATRTPTSSRAQPNPFASICGRVCAAPCEAKCRRGAIDAAISIRALKRFVCERFGVESEDFDLGRVYPQLREKGRERFGGGRKVAIVGAGPAGCPARTSWR